MVTEVDFFKLIKGGVDISLPITKQQFIDSIPNFIYNFDRLPYMNEDDVEVKIINDDKKEEIRPYRASRYINEFFNTKDELTKELFDKKIISYKLIADTLGLTEVVVRNAITKETKTPQQEVRRKLHMFFDKDLYEELGGHANLCNSCTRRCKQHYFVDVRCKNYKEKK